MVSRAGATAVDLCRIWGADWEPLARLLWRHSLIVHAALKLGGMSTSKFYTFPFITMFAQKLLTQKSDYSHVPGGAPINGSHVSGSGSAVDRSVLCRRLVRACRSYALEVCRRMFADLGTYSEASAGYYDMLEYFEPNVHAALKSWPGVDVDVAVPHVYPDHDLGDESRPTVIATSSAPLSEDALAVKRLSAALAAVLLLASRPDTSMR